LNSLSDLKGNRKIAGLALIIVGIIFLLFLLLFFILFFIFLSIGVTCIIGGIYVSISPKPIRGQRNRKIAGLALIIVGIVLVLLGFFYIHLYAYIYIYIGIACIIGGIYVSISQKPIPEQRKNIELVKKLSKILFMAGTIIIGISCLVIWWDLGTRFLGPMTGLYTFLVTPFYIFGVLLVVYSLHLIENKWGWLDFPIAIVFFVALWQISYRLAWFLVFPLNYVALLILFLASIKKELSD